MMGASSSTSTQKDPPCTCKAQKAKATSSGKGKTDLRNKDKMSDRKGKALQSEEELDLTLTLQLNSLSVVDKEEKIPTYDELPKNVLYYGWFFSPEVGDVIQEIAKSYFAQCRKVPQFERFLNAAVSAAGGRDPETFYRHPRKGKPTEEFRYHVTTKFLGREANEEYSMLAQPFVGRIFKIHLVGFFFTPKTFGIRVALTNGQQHLFDERDGGIKSESTNGFLKTLPLLQQKIEEDIEKSDKIFTTKKHPKCQSPIHTQYSDKPVTLIPLDPHDFEPSKSRAHITIGCAPKVHPMQTGLDLIDLIDIEKRLKTSGQFFQDYAIEGGTLRQFGRFGDAFIVYPCHKILTEATFKFFI